MSLTPRQRRDRLEDHAMTNDSTDLEIQAGELVRISDLTSLATVPAGLPAPVLGAVSAAATASPLALEAIRSAARSGKGLRVEFPPEVMEGLRNGTLQLLTTKSGEQLATAVKGGSKTFAANARVVGSADTAGKLGAGAVLTTGAVVMLPIAIAAIASYQQQQQLERALGNIQATLDRIEERLRDEEHGVCDAAGSFIDLALQASEHGPLPPYLRAELASHRVRVEGVYGARRRFIGRFKTELERQQIEVEQKKGVRQPWVETVQDMAKDGRLEDEIVLFIRALIAQSRLDAFAATCLAEEGLPELAMKVLHDSASELRSEFFDLHNRLSPLARIEPPRGVKDRVPLMSRSLAKVHATAKTLVDQLDQQVLPGIPDPRDDQPLLIELSAHDVATVAAMAAEAA